MKVFMESEEFGYEKFSADNLEDAFKIIRRLRKEALALNDGVIRKIGIIVND